jgi:LmbE family N-acetylglucosaminyl deacetylase
MIHFYTFSCLNNTRKQEWLRLVNYLKPASYNIFLHKGDMLPDRRYIIRRELEKIKTLVNPDIVFTHTLTNTHQSHIALAEEVGRIMRNTTVLGYAGVKSSPNYVPTVFFEISEKELEEKNKLISFIKSEGDKYFLQPELIKSVARVNGSKIGVEYAEAFDVVRMVV